MNPDCPELTFAALYPLQASGPVRAVGPTHLPLLLQLTVEKAVEFRTLCFQCRLSWQEARWDELAPASVGVDVTPRAAAMMWQVPLSRQWGKWTAGVRTLRAERERVAR